MAVKDDDERTGRKMKRDGGRGFGRRGRRGGGGVGSRQLGMSGMMTPSLPSPQLETTEEQ